VLLVLRLKLIVAAPVAFVLGHRALGSTHHTLCNAATSEPDPSVLGYVGPTWALARELGIGVFGSDVDVSGLAVSGFHVVTPCG